MAVWCDGHKAVFPLVSTKGKEIQIFREPVNENQRNLIVSLEKHRSEKLPGPGPESLLPASWQRQINKLNTRAGVKGMMPASRTLHSC